MKLTKQQLKTKVKETQDLVEAVVNGKEEQETIRQYSQESVKSDILYLTKYIETLVIFKELPIRIKEIKKKYYLSHYS